VFVLITVDCSFRIIQEGVFMYLDIKIRSLITAVAVIAYELLLSVRSFISIGYENMERMPKRQVTSFIFLLHFY